MSKHIILLVFLFLVFSGNSSAQEADRGQAYYDLGVFAYEDSDYNGAESYFLKAIELNKGNAYYHHFLGKTYVETKRYDEAKQAFLRANALNPEIPDLQYDIAFLDYQTGEYGTSAERFSDIASEEPENALAHYYAGISLYKLKRYDEAIIYLDTASGMSPTIKENGYYYIGICLKESGDLAQASEKLRYVIANSDSAVLRSNAEKWLDEINRMTRTRKPFSTYLKTGLQYDDNVRLDPLDQDLFSNEDDYLLFGYLSGKYNFINSEKNRFGAGYSYYQTKHDELGAYDLTGGIFNLNMRHRFSSFTFDLSYMPSYYWLDSRSYLMTHRVKPEIIFNMGRRLSTRISYQYYRNKYFQDPGKNGDRNEFSMELFYMPWKQGGYILFGIGHEDNNADHPDKDFERSNLKAGVLFPAIFNTSILLSGRYYDKQYDNADSFYGITREDDKYSCSISLSHRFLYDWLNVGVEYMYIKNDSNIDTYSYERNITTISLTARF